jgi:general secretion pathway protein K
MRRRLKDKSGVALILTVLIIGIIVAVTLEFSTAMRSELYAAVNLRDGIRLGCVARSGFDYALAVLFEDAMNAERPFDSLREPWADSKALSEEASSLFEDGAFEVQITDLAGRIQINALVNQKGEYNALQKDLLTRFLSFELFSLEAEEVDNLVDALKDWMDRDEEVTKFGAESAYYQTLEKPYLCRNAPLESLEELLLVRGMSRELFYGRGENPGISRFLTVYGDGKVNINTAEPVVLRSLSENLDQRAVEDMVSYRENEDNDISQPNWYKSVPGMSSEVAVDDLVTTTSQHFEIISEAFQDSMRKRVRGLVERKEGRAKIISWKVE